MSGVLLINPAFNIAKANYDSSLSVGLLSIASYLAGQGVEVKIIDQARQDGALEIIKEEAPLAALAALSVMTTQIPAALALSRLVREFNPNCKIVWGGSHPTFFPGETLAHELVDIVCSGEGEETMLELAQGRSLAEVKGILYKEKNEIVKNPPRALHDPAAQPSFNWDLVPPAILNNLSLVPSLTSRGCPHRCTFCLNAILKNNWRPRAVEQVLNDLAIIKNKPCFKGKPVRFWDENFFVNIKRAKAIIDGMIANGLTMPWETTIRVDYLRPGLVDDEFMARIKKSGCYLFSFGAESGSPVILKKIKKDVTPEQIVASAKQCLKHNIIGQYSFMIGLPGESKQDMMVTLKLIDELLALGDERIQILGPQAFRPYPGSDLYDECVRAGWQAPRSLEEWSHLVENELSYLTVQNFPWVRHKDFVESMEAYVRFGAHSVKSAMGSSVQARRWLKLAFVLICQLRWKLKFFAWPIEFKLAKKFIAN